MNWFLLGIVFLAIAAILAVATILIYYRVQQLEAFARYTNDRIERLEHHLESERRARGKTQQQTQLQPTVIAPSPKRRAEAILS